MTFSIELDVEKSSTEYFQVRLLNFSKETNYSLSRREDSWKKNCLFDCLPVRKGQKNMNFEKNHKFSMGLTEGFSTTRNSNLRSDDWYLIWAYRKSEVLKDIMDFS